MKNRMKQLHFKYFSLLSLIVFFAACENEGKKGNVSLVLNIDNASNLKGILQHTKINDVVKMDDVFLDENGHCELTFDVEEIGFYNVYFSDVQKEIIFLAEENDRVEVKADMNDLYKTMEFSGSKKMEQLNEFDDIVYTYVVFKDSLKKEYAALQKQNLHFAKDKEFNEVYKKKSIEMENEIKNFIDVHEGEFITLLALRSLNPKNSVDYFQKVNQSLSEKFPESEYVKYFNQEIQRLASLNVGGKAPVFTLTSNEDEELSLDAFKGKYVLLDFWATWCKPCIAEIPYLAKAKEKFGAKNFEIISVCIDRQESKLAWEKLIQDHNADWVHLYDSMGETADLYNIKAFPTLMLLNPEGEIVVTSTNPSSNFRRDGMLKKLDQIIQ